MLSGRRGIVRIRAGEPGTVIEVERDHVLALVQTDGELSEILLRAFILRRVELIAHGFGDVVLVRSEEHTSELQSRLHLVCRLLLEKKKNKNLIMSLARDSHNTSLLY